MLELVELLELPPLEPPLPELPLLEELPADEPLLPEPEELDPDEEDCVLDEVLAGAAARYITERTSNSIRRSKARANSVCSTSSCPDVENR